MELLAHHVVVDVGESDVGEDEPSLLLNLPLRALLPALRGDEQTRDTRVNYGARVVTPCLYRFSCGPRASPNSRWPPGSAQVPAP